MEQTKRIVIVGATSGIGYEVAKLYAEAGWFVGAAGRREDKLQALQQTAPAQVQTQVLDVTADDAEIRLRQLIEKLGGMDIFLLSSGIGNQNMQLEASIELNTLHTNATGFTRMVGAAFRYFEEKGGGHIAVISSIAGTKGIGAAPAYSATKRFQYTYIDALEQLARSRKLNISFTDIRPGFVQTAILKDTRYPMLMQPDKVAQSIAKALGRKKRRVVIDGRYAVLVFFWRLIPPALWSRLKISN